jgi:HAD superfamily hydrolase (TIGR01509 family)
MTSAAATPQMPLRAVLFDLDGTLVDSEPVHRLLWQRMLARHGHKVDPNAHGIHLAGVPALRHAQDLVARFDLDVSPQALADAKNEAVREHLAREPFPMIPDVRDALARLSQAGLVLAVVTGAVAHNVNATLEAHGLRAFFRTVVSGDEVEHNKPAPDAYLLALRRLGLPAGACAAVEDSTHGLVAAIDAGLRCIAVPGAHSRQQDFSRATATVARMTDAADLLLRWAGEPD